MTVHKLKILPQYFEVVSSMEKPFEVRKNDRDYQVGDILILREWEPHQDGPFVPSGGFTGNSVERKVSYVLPGGQFGIDPEYVVLGLKREL